MPGYTYDPKTDQATGAIPDLVRSLHDWQCETCAATTISGPPPIGWLVTRVRRANGTQVIAVACSVDCMTRYTNKLHEYDRLVGAEETGSDAWQKLPRTIRKSLGKIRQAAREREAV